MLHSCTYACKYYIIFADYVALYFAIGHANYASYIIDCSVLCSFSWYYTVPALLLTEGGCFQKEEAGACNLNPCGSTT